ncbi:MAG TPA: threonine/serine dehydratase [Gemmatimonadaceae bacterium]|nr:threonine/serine dehydratase [Gemmatimonadaceae bacterium]
MFTDLKPTEIFAAAHRIRDVVRRTPLRLSLGLSERAKRDVYLKLESTQITGSFKLRGAFNTVATLAPQVRARGIVASSAGNHGLGVAWSANHFHAPATIFVPRTAPRVKRDGIAALGATVNDQEPHYDAAMARAIEFAQEHDATFIHPCTGDALLAGQGTVALEILEELPDLATLVTPVGGGGLLGGCGLLLRHVSPDTRIVGAQSVNTAAMSRSLAAQSLVSIPAEPTLADGLAGDIDDIALDLGRHTLDDIVTVAESSIAHAIAELARDESLTVEGAGAVGIAALLEGHAHEWPGPVAIIVSGGNIDRDRLDAILAG